MQRFSVVLREDDYRLHRHTTEESAIAEAKRLAKKHGQKFVALTAVEIWGPAPKVQQYSFDEPAPLITEDEIPF
jgi:hypothetical protein